MAFLDLEKAYDSVPRELIWKTLVDKGIQRRYIRVIRHMYDDAKTRVRTSIENTEFFAMEVGLQQGSAISAYLFVLILDELSRGIQEDIPWCLIFADDIVLVSKSMKALNIRLENWRENLEDNGLRVSREKIEYLRCNFGGSGKIENTKVIYGKTLLDMIPNGFYRAQLEVEMITNKMRGLRRRDRSKLRSEDRVKHDINGLLLFEDMTSDRNKWRARIRLGMLGSLGTMCCLLLFLSLSRSFSKRFSKKVLVSHDLNDDSSHDVPNLVYERQSMPVELHVDEEHAINLEVLVDVLNTLSQEGHLISF
nr:ataxia telangiectasia mutated family protein [Tanacetum cinerariifolium]